MNLVKTHNMLMSVDLLSMFNLLLKQKDIIVFDYKRLFVNK